MAESVADSPDISRFHPVLNMGRYFHPWKIFSTPGPRCGLLRFICGEGDASNIPSCGAELDRAIPVIPLDKSVVAKPPEDGVRVTWLGHATVLVQMDGFSVLTDPVFTSRLGPVRIPRLPRRYRPPPCTVADLPQIDAVVISHNHYDHLESRSVAELNERFGDKLKWFVPTGLHSWMLEAGCRNVVELSWWNQETIQLEDNNSVTFACVPAQHFSNRGLTDNDKTLWCGWAVIGSRHKFYFAGDTGYNSQVFKLIGRRYGPFDLAAIPIGAYLPRWLMQPVHVDPDEAWKIHEDVKAYNSLAIHWGTFKLSSEFYLEPRDRIKQLREAANEQTDQRRGFFTENPGQSCQLNGWPR